MPRQTPSSQGVPAAARAVPPPHLPGPCTLGSFLNESMQSGAPSPSASAPVHAPAWQVSMRVQALPSLQAVPLTAGGFEQAPVAVSQTPATWQASSAAQVTGVDPTQTPAWQRSVRVQALPSLQGLLLA